MYCLASLLFFAPVFLNLEMLKGISYLIVGFTFFVNLPYILTFNYNNSRYGLLMVVWILIFLLSIIISFLQHGQDVFSSFRMILPFFVLFFYFFLHWNKVTITETENLIWIFLAIYLLMYFIGLAMAPRVLFDHTGGELDVNMQRGFSKVRILGNCFLHITYFMALNKWINKRETRHLILTLFLFVLVVLGVGRQVILFSFLLGLLMIMRTLKWYYSAFVLLLIVAAIIYVVSTSEIIQSLIDLTVSQFNETGLQNIRILAFKYYFTDYNDSIFQIIFGNGIPHLGNSFWGVHFKAMNKNTGYYLSDVGYSKIFFYWGIIGLISFFFLLYKIFTQKVKPELLYIKYYIAFIALTTIASHSFFLEMITISMVIYVLEKHHLETADSAVRTVNK